MHWEIHLSFRQCTDTILKNDSWLHWKISICVQWLSVQWLHNKIDWWNQKYLIFNQRRLVFINQPVWSPPPWFPQPSPETSAGSHSSAVEESHGSWNAGIHINWLLVIPGLDAGGEPSLHNPSYPSNLSNSSQKLIHTNPLLPPVKPWTVSTLIS